MRWLKHLSMAHADESIAYVLEEFGAEAYGVWWLILEDISAPMEPGKMEPRASHTVVKWASICHCSVRRFTSIAKTFADRRLIDMQSTDNRLQIEVRNILKYKDEYARKSGQSTPQERDREQREIERESRERPSGAVVPEIASPKNGSATAHGSRFALDHLPADWGLWAMKECGWSNDKAMVVFQKFRDYWIGQPGKGGRKCDWLATWRNWCRREGETRSGPVFPDRNQARRQEVNQLAKVLRGER